MNEIRKPLKKSILKGIGMFTLALGILLVGVQYLFLRHTLFVQYQTRLTYILREAETAIDPEDLAECIRTGEKSPGFRRTQEELNAIKGRTGVQYLYVIIPLNTDMTDNMRNVLAAVTEEEKDDPEAYVELNELSGSSYPQAVAKKYLDAYNSGGMSFFTNKTSFGNEYTGMTVLVHPETGEAVAALCADFDVNEIRSRIRENLLDILIVVVILGFLFATLFMLWADKAVVRPVRTLEKDVAELARKSHTSRNPDAMVYSAAEIQTGNEVESLAGAVERLSLDMRDYVKNLVEQERELARLSSVANRDPLTHVGNRNAYEKYAEGLQLKMTEGHIEFGILLADSNGLAAVNAKYGHDKGDFYLQKACRIVCEVFHHSPVFRTGGDEFAVMLLGEDYIHRRALMEEVQTICFRSAADENLPPWERVGVSFGLAEYNGQQDRTVQEVYDRAHGKLQEAKAERDAR